MSGPDPFVRDDRARVAEATAKAIAKARRSEVALPDEEQPVREVAQAIVNGEAFCDVDARRVAHAYLNVLVAGPYMGKRE